MKPAIFLSELLIDVLSASKLSVLPALKITKLVSDSREVTHGSLFIALAGAKSDGRDFIADALEKGASAVLFEGNKKALVNKGCIDASLQHSDKLISVENIAQNLGLIAARFYGFPSKALKLIGITGTNGKTTIAYFIAQMLDALNVPAGMIGTLGVGRVKSGEGVNALRSTGMTTPDALQTQALLAALKESNLDVVCMEVSSHGLALSRVKGVDFNQLVFSNLSQDHLDFHASMEEYAEVKSRLFTEYDFEHAIINQDDALGLKLIDTLGEAVISYGIAEKQEKQKVQAKHGRQDAALLAKHVILSKQGLDFEVHYQGESAQISTMLYGSFNVYNLLAVMGVGLAMGYSFKQVSLALGACENAPGRMERMTTSNDQATVIVDYAHTPDALEKALKACKAHCAGDLSLVFGCGGDRDKGKRPLMGAAAEKWADIVYLTDDNPRGEDPSQIVAEIVEGMQDVAWVLHDRAQAISTAILNAKQEDWVLIAGKGHESKQVYADRVIDFNDKNCALEVLEQKAA